MNSFFLYNHVENHNFCYTRTIRIPVFVIDSSSYVCFMIFCVMTHRIVEKIFKSKITIFYIKILLFIDIKKRIKGVNLKKKKKEKNVFFMYSFGFVPMGTVLRVVNSAYFSYL